MATIQSKVTSKGQVTLPKTLRSKLGIQAGDRLEFALEPNDRVSFSKKKTPGASAGCGKRFVSLNGKPPTVERMNEGIRAALKQRFGRGIIRE